uniref:Protein tantalus n=1 Tax=Zeugodacus cucurbitae TaxID=28588 RepID=A0A0A1X1R4_ZEUCU
MERIVAGIAKINFQQNFEDILVESRFGNMAAQLQEMSRSVDAIPKCNSNDNTIESDIESDINSSSETNLFGDDDADSTGSSSKVGGTFSQRRNLPRRACKENSLKVKRRSIMKPKRQSSSTSCDFSMLRPAEIRKIYCNKKLKSFRPACLETIFEEPQSEPRRGDDTVATCSTALRLIGLRKIRRSLSCSDGLNTNKTLIKQRRAKIKKVFGRRSACKKISLHDFIDRLNKSFGDEADVEDADLETDDNNPQDEVMEAEISATTVDSSTPATTPNTSRTDFAMQLETELVDANECSNKNIEREALYSVPNNCGTLSYSSDTADTSLTSA